MAKKPEPESKPNLATEKGRAEFRAAVERGLKLGLVRAREPQYCPQRIEGKRKVLGY